MATTSTMDGPGRLLAAAVRWMPEERRDWGAAMLAELAQLQHPSARWRFALGCARVALFPPRKGGLLQTIMKRTKKSIITTLGSAALISFILLLPFMILESVNRRNLHESFPVALFGFLWLLPVTFIVILVPMVRAVRTGQGVMANPINLLFRVTFLALIAAVWGWGLIDQLPCFLGVPNCD